RGDHQCDASCLAKLQGRLRVLVDENFLDRRRLRRVIGNHRIDHGGEVGEAGGELFAWIGLQLPVGDMAQAVAFGGNDSPTGRSQAGIKTEDDQASFSSSSSGTS